MSLRVSGQSGAGQFRDSGQTRLAVGCLARGRPDDASMHRRDHSQRIAISRARAQFLKALFDRRHRGCHFTLYTGSLAYARSEKPAFSFHLGNGLEFGRSFRFDPASAEDFEAVVDYARGFRRRVCAPPRSKGPMHVPRPDFSRFLRSAERQCECDFCKGKVSLIPLTLHPFWAGLPRSRSAISAGAHCGPP